MHGWASWLGLLMMAVVVLIPLAVAFALVIGFARPRQDQPRPDVPQGPQPSEADRLLDERFARGEIDEADYLRRRTLLHGG
jgi:putative membrane protein